MRQKDSDIDIKLLAYIDHLLDAGEAIALEKQMADDKGLRQRYETLREMVALMAHQHPETPGNSFTEQVMKGIREQPREFTRGSIWKGIFLLAGIALTIGLASVLVTMGAFDTPLQLDLTYLPKLTGRPTSAPSIPFNGKLVIQAIILCNLVIAFFVLDRTVLRPWFKSRTSHLA